MEHERGYLETGLNEMKDPAKADATILANFARGIDIRIGDEMGSRVLYLGKSLRRLSASPEGDVE